MSIWKEVQLDVNDGASNADAEITNVLSITVPDEMVNTVTRAPAFDDTVVPKEPGLISPGTLEFETEYDEALLARLEALKGVTGKQWKITLPAAIGGAVFTYTGFLVKAVKSNLAGPEAEAKIAATVEITSDVTVT